MKIKNKTWRWDL